MRNKVPSLGSFLHIRARVHTAAMRSIFCIPVQKGLIAVRTFNDQFFGRIPWSHGAIPCRDKQVHRDNEKNGPCHYKRDADKKGDSVDKCKRLSPSFHFAFSRSLVTQYTPSPLKIGLKHRLYDLHLALLRSPAFHRLIRSGSLMNGRLMEI